MAEKKSIKLTQIAKDFNLKGKDVIDIFKSVGIEKKTGGGAEPEEYELFIHLLTSTHQIKNVDDYIDGKTKITVVAEKKAEAPKEAPKTEAPKTEAPKTEAPKAEAPKTEAPKTEAPKAQAPKAQTQSQPQRPGQRPQGASAPTQRQGDGRGDGRRPQGQQGGGVSTSTVYRAPEQRRGDRPYQRYNDRPSEDPFAKRRADMTRTAEGYRRDGTAKGGTGAPRVQDARVEQKKPVTPTTPAPTAPKKPETATPTVLPAQKAQQEKAQKAAQQTAAPKKTETAAPKPQQKAQKRELRTITPTPRQNVEGGVNIGVEYTPERPKTRVVDMRSSDVDVSKYDDRYNERFYAIANGVDTRAQKQKLKKQDNKGQHQKSARDKERAAQEKIKRMEAERARNKQLEITVPDEITVSELAIRLKKTSAEVIKKLMLMGEMKGLNDVIDYATAELIADEFGAKVTKEIVVTIEEKLFTEAEDNEEDIEERAPVVCVMGHVDHGKTSILDAIRHTSVTKGEAGGITQAIGAYRVRANDKDITFLDTPGHEAFTAMRMRGAKSTDIAILVVAADDGVMPQTVEAISHAKAAGIDIIVAINKMDKPTANPDNVLNQLTQYELVPEAWGGDVICVPVSAHTGMGIEDLLESVLLVAEVKELRANPRKRARGLVIESKLDRGRGPVATVLVQNGTLHQGDYVIVGNAVGRVRAMVDDKGKTIKSAGPSVPVEIIGLDDVPQAGDELNAVEDEKMARSLADQRREKQRQEILAANARVNLDELFSQISDGVKTLNIIVKADVAGSAEAVKSSLLKLSGEEVKVHVIHSAVGGITESDVMLAAASNAIITGFNVRPDKNALDSAERNGVDIRTHRIIYEIIEEIEAAMKGMLAPTYREVLLGHAEVRQTIRVPNVGTIAGCYVKSGKITRQSQIRIVRDGIVIFEDAISSLKRFKDDAKEVAEGYECGVGLAKFNDIKEGDILEAFIMEEVKK